MNIRKTRFFAAVLGAAFIAANPPDVLRYTAGCAVTGPTSADGYVTNLSRDTYVVAGQVRFVFTSANSMSRPAIGYPANSIVPAGQTVRVARVRLAFLPQPGDTCEFDVKDAVRKQ